jgi:hypothetical protein
MFSRLRAGLTFANVTALTALIVAVGGGSAALALFQTSPDSNGVIHACWNVSTGALRIDFSQTGACRRTERPLAWPSLDRAPGQSVKQSWQESGSAPPRLVLRMRVANGSLELKGQCFPAEGAIALDVVLSTPGLPSGFSHSALRVASPSSSAPAPILASASGPFRVVELRTVAPASQRQHGEALVRLRTKQGDKVARIEYTASVFGRPGRPGFCDIYGVATWV